MVRRGRGKTHTVRSGRETGPAGQSGVGPVSCLPPGRRPQGLPDARAAGRPRPTTAEPEVGGGLAARPGSDEPVQTALGAVEGDEGSLRPLRPRRRRPTRTKKRTTPKRTSPCTSLPPGVRSATTPGHPLRCWVEGVRVLASLSLLQSK